MEGKEKRITYWGPKVHHSQRTTDMFEYVASPYDSPLYLEAPDVDSSNVSVVHKLEVNGFIYLGLSTEEDPRKVRGARIITEIGSKPDLRTLRQLTIAYFD